MKITIYAEDTYSIAPILARKITGVMPDFQQISLNDMLSLKSLGPTSMAQQEVVRFSLLTVKAPGRTSVPGPFGKFVGISSCYARS